MGAAALPASLTSQHWVPSCSNAVAQTHVRNQPSPSAPTGTGRAQHPGAGRGCPAQHPGALRAPRASARQAGARRRRGRPVGRLNSPEGLRSPPEGGLGTRRGPGRLPASGSSPPPASPSAPRRPHGARPGSGGRAGGRRRRGRPLRRGFKLAGKSRGVGSGSPTTALPQRGTPPPPPPSPPGSEGTPPGRQRSRPLPAPPPAMAARGAERRGRAGGSAGGSPPARSAL